MRGFFAAADAIFESWTGLHDPMQFPVCLPTNEMVWAKADRLGGVGRNLLSDRGAFYSAFGSARRAGQGKLGGVFGADARRVDDFG